MAMQTISGDGIWFPYTWHNAGSGMSTFQTAGPIDATGEKVAQIGRVWTPNGGSKTITGVEFRTGTVTSGGGSNITVSLQNVDTANGPPWQPDGTPDQSVTVALSSLSSSTWTPVTFGTTRSVTHGDPLAVVFEYDAGGRLGSDALNLSGFSIDQNNHSGGGALLTASWASLSAFGPNVILVFDDGTYGKFEATLPVSSMSNANINSGTATDEIALRFQVPFACQVNGLMASFGVASGSADFDIVLYEGTTALQTVSVDGNTVQNATSSAWRRCPVSIPVTSFSPNTVYYVALKPTTANNLNYPFFDVSAASRMAVHDLGTSAYLATRADAGAWSTTTTRRPLGFGFRICALDDGASGGGGGGSSRMGLGIC